MNNETLQGYACWVVAAALLATVLVIVVASLVSWLS
jgi:hypothetical protein